MPHRRAIRLLAIRPLPLALSIASAVTFCLIFVDGTLPAGIWLIVGEWEAWDYFQPIALIAIVLVIGGSFVGHTNVCRCIVGGGILVFLLVWFRLMGTATTGSLTFITSIAFLGSLLALSLSLIHPKDILVQQHPPAPRGFDVVIKERDKPR